MLRCNEECVVATVGEVTVVETGTLLKRLSLDFLLILLFSINSLFKLAFLMLVSLSVFAVFWDMNVREGNLVGSTGGLNEFVNEVSEFSCVIVALRSFFAGICCSFTVDNDPVEDSEWESDVVIVRRVYWIRDPQCESIARPVFLERYDVY